MLFNPDPNRCAASVWHRDTYRRTGRGRTGFELHYIEEQCKRKPVPGKRHCTQHGKIKRDDNEGSWISGGQEE